MGCLSLHIPVVYFPFYQMRSNVEREKNDGDDIPSEEKGSVTSCEINYV